MRVPRQITSSRSSTTTRYRPDRWDYSGWSHQPDPFAVNPIRRSAILVVASALAFFGPLMLSGPDGAMTIIAGAWLGLIGLAFGIPVLVLSLGEELYRRLMADFRPAVDRLDLSPRIQHILVRHGYESIAAVEQAPDAVLLLLSNMEQRDIRAVRRAISLWRYRAWQAQGFP